MSDESPEQLKAAIFSLSLRHAIDIETNEMLTKALGEAIEDICWMSAASDFGPDGQAHEGWVKVRARLEHYNAALANAMGEHASGAVGAHSAA